MGTKAALQGRLPSADLDGLSAQAGTSLRNPQETVTVVAVLAVGKIETDLNTDDVTVKYQIEAIEAVAGGDEQFLLSTLKAANAARTGRTEIDGFEDALRAANPSQGFGPDGEPTEDGEPDGEGDADV